MADTAINKATFELDANSEGLVAAAAAGREGLSHLGEELKNYERELARAQAAQDKFQALDPSAPALPTKRKRGRPRKVQDASPLLQATAMAAEAPALPQMASAPARPPLVQAIEHAAHVEQQAAPEQPARVAPRSKFVPPRIVDYAPEALSPEASERINSTEARRRPQQLRPAKLAPFSPEMFAPDEPKRPMLEAAGMPADAAEPQRKPRKRARKAPIDRESGIYPKVPKLASVGVDGALAKNTVGAIKLKGALSGVASAADKSGGAFHKFFDSLNQIPGPVGSVAGRIDRLASILGGGSAAGQTNLTRGLALGSVGLGLFSVAATASGAAIAGFAIAQASAAEKEQIHLRSLGALRGGMALTAAEGMQLGDVIDRVAKTSSLSKDDVGELATTLLTAGLQRKDLEAGLQATQIVAATQGESYAKKFAETIGDKSKWNEAIAPALAKVNKQLGGLASDSFYTLGAQWTKLKDTFGSIFDDVNLKPLMGTIAGITQRINESGHSFKNLGDAVVYGLAYAIDTVELWELETEIAIKKVRRAFNEFFSGSTGPIGASRAALEAFSKSSEAFAAGSAVLLKALDIAWAAFGVAAKGALWLVSVAFVPVMHALDTLLSAVRDTFKIIGGVLGGFIETTQQTMSGVASAIDQYKGGKLSLADLAVEVLSSFATGLGNGLAIVGKAISSFGNSVFALFVSAFKPVYELLSNVFSSVGINLPKLDLPSYDEALKKITAPPAVLPVTEQQAQQKQTDLERGQAQAEQARKNVAAVFGESAQPKASTEAEQLARAAGAPALDPGVEALRSKVPARDLGKAALAPLEQSTSGELERNAERALQPVMLPKFESMGPANNQNAPLLRAANESKDPIKVTVVADALAGEQQVSGLSALIAKLDAFTARGPAQDMASYVKAPAKAAPKTNVEDMLSELSGKTSARGAGGPSAVNVEVNISGNASERDARAIGSATGRSVSDELRAANVAYGAQ